MPLFKGSGVALVTPMKENFEIDYDVLASLIEWQIEQNTDAIIVAGTTGETPTLTKEEHMELIKFTVDKVAGRVPVIAGTGSNSTAHAIVMSQYAQSAGVDGLLLVTPYYNKSTQEGLIAHYHTIADSVTIPCILYNVPGRTGINIHPNTVKILSNHANIVGIKEASGDIAQAVEISRITPDNFGLWCGNDDIIVPMLSIGGHGVISVLANIMPKQTHDMCQSYFNGDVKKSAQIQLKTKPLIDKLFCETNPIPIKEALNMMNKNAGPVRLPLVKMSQKHREQLRDELADQNLLK